MEVEEDRNQDKAGASDPNSSSENGPEENPPSPPRKTKGGNRVSLLLPDGEVPVGTKAEVFTTPVALKHPTTPAFLSKPLAAGRDGRPNIALQFKKKQTLILKAKLPPTKGIDPDSQTREVLQYVWCVFSVLWDRDPFNNKGSSTWS